MSIAQGLVRPRGLRLVVTLAVPWAFVVGLAAVYFGVLLPGALGGHSLAVVGSVLLVPPLISFIAAAITFTRDVLMGRVRLD